MDGRIILLFFVSGLIIGCGTKKENKVVAQIGSYKVTLEELRNRIEDMPPSYQGYLITRPGQKQFIDVLVRERIMIEEARKQKIHKREEIIDAIKEYKKNYEKELKEYERNLLFATLLEDLQEKEFISTESELKEYYEEHKKQFRKPVEMKISHILVSSESDAEKVIERIDSGENFDEVAREISIDPASSIYGGNLGTFREGELLPEFETVVKKLRVGKISRIVKTSNGYHIIKKTKEKKLPSESFEDAKENIQKILVRQKFDRWIKRKRQELNVKVENDVFLEIKGVGENESNRE